MTCSHEYNKKNIAVALRQDSGWDKTITQQKFFMTLPLRDPLQLSVWLVYTPRLVVRFI